MKKLLYLLVFTAVLYPQQNEKIIAKIGNISISENEFRIRFELAPRINSPADAIGLQSKKNFLYGIITEKLLSLGAHESGFDTIESVKNTIQTFEKMFVRDALYKKVVVEKSKKYADSLLDFYLQVPTAINTRFIVNKDSSSIQKIWKLLNKGISFDSIFVDLSKYEKDTSTILLGQLEDKVERQLFTLYEGSTSKPIKIDDGWYIFHIVRKNDPANIKSATWESNYKEMVKAAKTKAEDKFYREYVGKFFTQKKVEANGFLLKSFAEKVSSIFAEKSAIQLKGSKLYLETNDIVKIESLFGRDSLMMTFVKIPGKELSLNDYLHWYRFENFNSESSSYKTVAGLLNGKTKKFIEDELLYSEGIKEGLQNSPSVQSDLRMWKDSYLSQLTSSVFYDSVKVTDNDLLVQKNSTDTTYAPVEINIAQIVTDNLDTVEEVLNALRSGKDIHELAAKYSKSDSLKNKVESGFVSTISLGDIGRIAVGMNIGDVYGPLKLSNGYSVFELLGKRKAEQLANSTASNKELKDQIYYQRVREKLNNYTSSLAEKYKIQINDENLSKIELTKIVSFVFRNLGFGGRITAVPFNTSDIEWVKKYKETNNL